MFRIVWAPGMFVLVALIAHGCGDPESPRTARIRLDSDPAGARIWIDGQLRAETTPAWVGGLTPGPHWVRLKLAGYRPWKDFFYVSGALWPPKVKLVERTPGFDALQPPPPPLPESWTPQSAFPNDLRAVRRVQPAMGGFPSETVITANATSGQVTYEYSISGGLESGSCRYAIGPAELAAFGWPEFMALVEQRRRHGLPPRVDDDDEDFPAPVVDPVSTFHASLRAHGETATEDVISRNGLQGDLLDRIRAVASGAQYWAPDVVQDRLRELAIAVKGCRAPNVQLYVRAEISAIDGRARLLSIQGEQLPKTAHGCVTAALDQVRLPVGATARACNLDWRINAGSHDLLPNPYRRE